MDKRFLLLYQSSSCKCGKFSWFETLDEMMTFADNVHVIYGFDMTNSEQIM